MAAAAQQAVATVMRVEMSAVRQALNDLAHDVKAVGEITQLMDVPLEQVADSHERASASFETLRGEIAALAETVRRFDQVLDQAGLHKAAHDSQERFLRLATSLENRMLEHSQTMVKVLTMIEQIQQTWAAEAASRIARNKRRRR